MPLLNPIFSKLIILLIGGMVVMSPFTWTERDPLWSNGTYKEYQWDGKIYDEPSKFGINGGRISKLTIKKNGEWVFNYDRGYDVVPKDQKEKEIVKEIVKQIEKNIK